MSDFGFAEAERKARKAKVLEIESLTVELNAVRNSNILQDSLINTLQAKIDVLEAENSYLKSWGVNQYANLKADNERLTTDLEKYKKEMLLSDKENDKLAVKVAELKALTRHDEREIGSYLNCTGLRGENQTLMGELDKLQEALVVERSQRDFLSKYYLEWFDKHYPKLRDE